MIAHNNVIIVDDILSIDEMDDIEKMVLDRDNFAWYFIENTFINDENSDKKYDFAFLSHTLIRDGLDNSKHSDIAKRLVKKFYQKINQAEKDIIRATVNLTFPEPSLKTTIKHRDQPYSHKVLIYYINDADGDTIIYDHDEVNTYNISPKRGRFLFFDGSYFHCGTPPSKKHRLIINFNIKI